MILSDDDLNLAYAAGRRRHARRRQSPNHVASVTATVDIEAVAAEIACARHLGLEWKETDTPDSEGDLGFGIQVRHTRYEHGRLLLHPKDADTHRFYLVTGTPPDLTVRGWILGWDGKNQDLWVELLPGRACFAVPQEMLSSPGVNHAA